MKPLPHTSAKPSHYNHEAKQYDIFNESDFNKRTNPIIEKLLKKHKVKSVLDLTCGTGGQIFYLGKRGYEVVGSDINTAMLKIAQNKASSDKLNIKLFKGDMRTTKAGEFDAVITIFNAVGHLTKTDFAKAMRNIHSNLKNGGIYLFDIYNLNYLLKDNNITKLTIDWQKKTSNGKARVIQYSTIDTKGVLASYTTAYEQHGAGKPKITKGAQTLQVYTAMQLQEILHKTGFKVIGKCGIDGSKFSDSRTEQMFIVARKCKI
jgi:SAM-dependent methyltransferase